MGPQDSGNNESSDAKGNPIGSCKVRATFQPFSIALGFRVWGLGFRV